MTSIVFNTAGARGLQGWPRHSGRAMLIVALVFLSLPQGSATAATQDLAGSNWRPLHIGAISVPEDARAFVRFEADGRLTGRGGCNRFFGTFKTSGSDIALGPIGSTRMACHQPVMVMEVAFFDALANTTSFQRGATSLRLFDGTGREIATLVSTD